MISFDALLDVAVNSSSSSNPQTEAQPSELRKPDATDAVARDQSDPADASERRYWCGVLTEVKPLTEDDRAELRRYLDRTKDTPRLTEIQLSEEAVESLEVVRYLDRTKDPQAEVRQRGEAMHAEVARYMSTAGNSGNVHDYTYQYFRERLAARFTSSAAGPLFTTNADIWPIYLGSFPEEARQYHNCSTCRHFLRAYGGLATIDECGQGASAVWDPADADADHARAVAAMASAVSHAKITGVFLSGTAELGREVTGAWAHLALRLPANSPALSVPRPLTAGQAMAARTQDHQTVMRALSEFPLELLERVVELLKTDALYRTEKVRGPAEWLRNLAAAKWRTGKRANVVWRAIATAPSGFCHPRTSVLGTLLDDLASGMSFDDAARRFADKMHPLQYQRPQAPPSEGQVAAAERLVEQLGIAAALPRRFARLDEIETVWRPRAVEAQEKHGVFSHLVPKRSPGASLHVAEQAITWTRFARDVLPDALAIEVFAPARGNYYALVTAVDPNAPPILQWDRPERRNPVSWYGYHGGSFATVWGLMGDTWVPVTGLALKPSMWGDRPLDHQGRAGIAIIEGARDGNRPRGGGLFPENLRAELHAVRAVIEAYTRTAQLAGHAEASACGLRFGDSAEVRLRVTTRTGSRFTYRVDRWE